MLKGNKGEWSELYVLFKLLGEGKVYSGDGLLNRLESFYPVLNILRDELDRHLEYLIDKDIVVVTENDNEIARINVTEFLEKSKELFLHIVDKHDRKAAFEIPVLEGFLNKIHCEKIKAKSKDKADIHIVIHDYHTGLKPKLGFSIKSDAGSNPTLLNASKPTVITYELVGNEINDNIVNEINSINGNRKIQDRVNEIYSKGISLNFSEIKNVVFRNNLRLIDSCLPDIIAWMLQDCYYKRDMKIVNAVERIHSVNPLDYDLSNGHDFYGYKIKSLMVCTALGMLPATPWNGRYEATGGYIVVKKDGDVICFHIYDRNLLEDYLFHNTKFETPKNERYQMGQIYKTDDKYYFDLVLQIRFL